MMDEIKNVEKLLEKTSKELEKVKEKFMAVTAAIHETQKSLIPTDAVFKDGHREKIVYLKEIGKDAYEFATGSGMYVCCKNNPEYIITKRGLTIPSLQTVNFYKVNSYVENDYVVLHRSIVDIQHIEFEIGGKK